MKKLTLKQEAVLTYIKNFISDNGYSPVAKEVQIFFGYASQNAAIDHLKSLERKGYIRTTPRIARSIVVI